LRLNSPRRNYRPFEYGNYNRPINKFGKDKERTYFRSPESSRLGSSSIRRGELRQSRIGQPYRKENNPNLARSKVGRGFDTAWARNYSVEKFVK
jgi:hypothetical protein